MRTPCCSKDGLNKGAWTREEDEILAAYVEAHGPGRWSLVPKEAGLRRCGKSCRLRWLNYLRPGIKRGDITHEEEDLIVRLHKLLGNKWSLIAGRLPGRTDNEIKNYWNTNLKKKVQQITDFQQPQQRLSEYENRSQSEILENSRAAGECVVRTKVAKDTRILTDPLAEGEVEFKDSMTGEDSTGTDLDVLPYLDNHLMLNEGMQEDWMASRTEQPCFSWENGFLGWFMD